MNIVEDVTLPGREGGAWLVEKGRHIRVIDVEGGAIGDFVCFNADKLTERFSQARTKANQGKFLLSPGDHLYSRDNAPILTIAEDTYGIHDLQYGMCSAWVYDNFADKDYHGFSASEMGVGGPLGVPPFGCYEVLQKALRDWPIEPHDIPDELAQCLVVLFVRESLPNNPSSTALHVSWPANLSAPGQRPHCRCCTGPVSSMTGY